ncbi:FAD-dependent oxidoreductase [Agromyces sp. SYSU T0242]|uniref:FAD-dependent oxidoreductase n=1 Tax=Agromyces litoreus TaxID=3158561 RepID=UPI003397BD19
MGSAAAKITPELTDAQWERLRRYGTPEDVTEGDVLFRAGDRSYDLFLIESGEVEIVREALWWTEETTIARLGPRTFAGELGLLNGQKAFLTGRVTTPGTVARIDHPALQRMMAEDDELCDLMLRTLWARRELLREGPAAWTLKIVGSSNDAASMAVRRYAQRLELVHTWIDVEDPELTHDIWSHGYRRDDLPVAIVQGEIVRNATPGQLAEMLGLAYAAEDDIEFDLAVVGAGPAGLAAAIYGASEGLHTVLLDAVAPGGQSATTSRIENYLGFPFGVSGDALTSQASLQAFKFGVRIAAPCPVIRLDADAGVHRLLLADGAIVRARAVVVTTGVAYRTLPIDRWDEFEGAGIHHAASALELRQVAGSDVVVIGGANSAGQAALALAANDCNVRLVVRSGDLSDRMSSYLVDRIREDPRIDVRTGAQVVALDGDDHLERVTLRGPDGDEVVDSAALFCFIGAVPATDWLGHLDHDDSGYVRTGADVAALDDGWRDLGRTPLPFETSVPRVFAAGDVRRGSMKRVAAAVGEGSSAVASVHRALSNTEVTA